MSTTTSKPKTCSDVGLRAAPKRLKKNWEYRSCIAEKARCDEGFRRHCWDRSKDDPIWYIDTFLFTYNPKLKSCPIRPFILYDFQEDAIKRILRAIGHEDILIEKSRDMGASWINLTCFEYLWHFHAYQSFLMGSRKEEYVDKSGDPKSLFWKILFILKKQPGWLRPRYRHTKLHLENLDNGSTIDGESTNQDFATGDRRTAVLLDEFSLVEDGQKILTATRDVTDCRVFNATPKGARGAYYSQKRAIEKSRPDCIIRMHWSQHPVKAQGLYTTVDGKIEILDKNYDWKRHYPKGYEFILDEPGKLRAPWYDRQCEREPNVKSIAQELDINYHESGWGYFSDKVLDSYIDDVCLGPLCRGDIDADYHGGAVTFTEKKNGPLRMWLTPDHTGNFRLDQSDYVVACDIATGKGGKKSSNSVVVVYDRTTRTKVAQWWSNSITPTEFAQYAVLLCKFFTGKSAKPAYLIWEDNGPGGEFAKEVSQLRYTNVFHRENETVVAKKKTMIPGWWSDRAKKRMLLSEYAKQLTTRKLTNYCLEAVKECREYEQDPMGNVYHVGSIDEDDLDHGENHGDMVIADALACRAMDDWATIDGKADENDPPPGSPGYRRKKWENAQRAKNNRYGWRTYRNAA